MKTLCGVLLVLVCLLAGLVLVCLLAGGLYLWHASGEGTEPAREPLEVQTGYAAAKLPEGPEPGPDAIVFEMTYRGLDADNEELRYNAYWGYGGRDDSDNPFIRAVKKVAGHIKTVYNPNFKGAEWAAVELVEGNPVALYFDMNANGKLADNEKILPAAEPDKSGMVEFVTPDFVMTAADGSRIPFRVLLQARKGGSCMWSPSCVLQGDSTINDKKVRIFLFCSGPGGTFTQFGRGSYSLVEEEPNEGYGRVLRQTLSSLINYDDQFYRLRFLKSAEKESSMRLVLEKDTSPTGQLAVKLAGREGLKARLSNVKITGSRDSTISFSVGGDKGIKLPAGEYKIASGYIYYSSQKDDEWYVSFSGDQEIEIKDGELFTFQLGEPRILVSALDQKDRYRSNAEEKTVYAKGTTIFLSPKVRGKGGELYTRFARRESNRRNTVPPTVEITDSDGKQVASAKMEYG